ncbi:hypothetical protein EC973_004821 [Apophysomyces ossiformis]|uniref:Uncharacterized protein n=1 Tax=Apophysomyces ossiformis TaxID=679940 RepID=A0A8H7BHW2_9FUNG|nr:hypothetical protein EC973_004821 [Apophysomyces ossiformis]
MTTEAASANSSTDLAEKPKTIDDVLADFRLLPFQTQRFPSFMNDHDMVMQNIRQALTSCVDAALDLEELKEHDKIAPLDASVRTLIDLEHQINCQKAIFGEIEKDIKDHVKIGDAVGAYNDRWEQKMARYQALPPKKKYFTNDNYVKFKQEVWDVHHPNDPMPALGDSGDDDDGDIIVGQTKVSLKCPLTTDWYQDPVTT